MNLAFEEKPCIACIGEGFFDSGQLCPTCRGKGSIPKYPELRKRCLICSFYSRSQDSLGYLLNGEKCPSCEGRGWMPIELDMLSKDG